MGDGVLKTRHHMAAAIVHCTLQERSKQTSWPAGPERPTNFCLNWSLSLAFVSDQSDPTPTPESQRFMNYLINVYNLMNRLFDILQQARSYICPPKPSNPV